MRSPRSSVSVLVPVFNEGNTLNEVVERLLALPAVAEIIVVDDGSRDGAFGGFHHKDDCRVRVLRHEQNLGKGAAVRTAIQHATGDIVVIQDADLEYSPEGIPELLEPIKSGLADVVYGTRFHDAATMEAPPLRNLANRLLTQFSNWATGLSLSDMETGHKAFRREVFSGIEIKENRFGFEPEITAKLARRGVRLVEVPISYKPRSYADGKKIGFRDGLRALWCILRYR